MKMCIVCGLAVQKWFPLLSREEHLNILFCGTCFPAGCGDEVDQQLADLSQKSHGNYLEAMCITHKELDAIWERRS